MPRSARANPAWTLSAFALVAVAAALVIFFDWQTPVAFGDEWVHRWVLQHAAATHHLSQWPSAVAANLLQYTMGLPAAVLSHDPRWLRLTVLPWTLISMYYSWRIARRLGADRPWSAIAATLLVCNPLYLSVATGFLSDPAYLALLTAACWYGLVWIESGRGIVPMALATGLAVAQRQTGVGLVVAMAAALFFAFSRRRVDQREWAGLALLCGAAGLAVLLLPLTGLATPAMGMRLDRLSHPGIGAVVGTIVAIGPMLGLLLLPVAPALAIARGDGPASSRWQLVPVGLAVIAVSAGLALALAFGTDIFPGGNFGLKGLGPIFLHGDKPSLLPLPLYLTLEAAVTAAYLIVLVRRRAMWSPASLDLAGVWLVAAATSQLLRIPANLPAAKYFLAMLAPLVPLVIARGTQSPATRARRWPLAVTLAIMTAGVGFFAVGQQDHDAWEIAADAAARQAYERTPPLEVNAGYEANATYIGIPAFEASRHLPPGVDYLFVNPPHPKLELLFALADDPRPGVSYQSVAPGKIVIQTLR